MKTSVTRKKDEGSPHSRYEDLGDKEKRGEKSSSSVGIKTSVTRIKTKKPPIQAVIFVLQKADVRIEKGIIHNFEENRYLTPFLHFLHR
ncbi:hypothetical protein FZC76_12155 [Sutcliffiella horikoshii]|uniref:Uncharacterized protein n=1 Tax=Sutcliffiella horikoshii TaxID=79883 RepID=A0A5D4SYH2_9BACI|nr:hypothetical protein FZC76_12155 [Sutcliffiella horikoshii]